ncbi:MAG: hypothetical protein ACI4XG_20140 [Bradyrhizobium sp.]
MGFAALYPSYDSAIPVIAMPKTVIARESGRSSIPETVILKREAAAYWIARQAGR